MSRLEAQPGGGARLYIAALGVLAPHRGAGLGAALLERALAACAGDAAIRAAALHVHAGDEEARGWYLKRGFEVRARIAGYYRRLDPPDALLLERRLNHSGGGSGGDGGGGGGNGGGAAAAAEGDAAADAAAGGG